MRYRSHVVPAIFAGVFVLLVGSCDQGQTGSAGSQNEPKGRVMAQLSVGDGVQYAHINTPERLPVGPAGIFTTGNGYAVADNVGGSIIMLNANFGMERSIDLREVAQGITAVAQDGDDVVVLDGFSASPKILRVSSQGSKQSVDIGALNPTPPTGLKRDDNGLVLDYASGETLYRVNNGGSFLNAVPTEGYVWGGKTFSVEKAVDSDHRERLVHVGSASALIRVPNYLGLVQIIGPDQNGGVYVLVEDVKMAETVAVDQSVWHINTNGKIVNISFVPLEERKTYIDHGVAIDGSGEPVAMVTKSEGLQFWSLAKRSPSLILDSTPSGSGSGVEVSRENLITYSGTCLTSAQMQSNAQEYLNVSQYLSSNNINNNGTCTTRTKPNYLGSAGTYSSVSYDWGGWDTPSAFQSAMNSSGKAGNLNTAASLSCSYGVDCSGFVTRVWGFTDWKRGTCDFSSSSTSKGPAYGPGYYVGDAFALCGTHVVIYAGPGSNGLYIWESAGEPYARVVYRFTSWSYLSGYYSWRSKTSCN